MNLVRGSAAGELRRFFQTLHGKELPEAFVTKSAFSMARKKLKHSAFQDLTERVGAFFYKHFPYRTWRGVRVLAIDGSTLGMPKVNAIAEWFGQWGAPRGRPGVVGRVSLLFDVLNEVPLHALLLPKRMGEREVATEHLCHLRAQDLVVLDRGYSAYWLFQALRRQGAQFCARMSTKSWSLVGQFVASGASERVVEILPSSASLEHCQRLGLPTGALPVRLVRVALPNGEIEVLATSLLDTSRYPQEAFGSLYAKRWPVEEAYKLLKCRAEIAKFSGKSVEAVLQDFHAKVLTTAITAVLVHAAQPAVDRLTAHRQRAYKINKTQALSTMKQSIVLLLTRTDLSTLVPRLLALIATYVDPVRPGRSFPRYKTIQRRGTIPGYMPIS